jgi:hypothetical protein
MRLWQRIPLAYLVASGSVVGPGLVGAELARAWGIWPALDPWHAVGALWLLVVGGPSMGWASGFLGRALGLPAIPAVEVLGLRRIPIFGHVPILQNVLAETGTLRLRRHTLATVDVADRLAFHLGQTVVGEYTMRHFLARAWQRQDIGEDGLSRTWWVGGGRIERPEYEAILSTLAAHGFVKGRRQGASGRLAFPPHTILSEFRHRYGIG